jgi:hypothetical protein
MKKILLVLVLALTSVIGKAQAVLRIDEVDLGLLGGYHMLLVDYPNFILGEEYEIGAYMHETTNGAMIAITTSYVRNGAFGTQYLLPQNNYAVGKFTTAKLKIGKLWEGDYFDVMTAVGLGYFAGADYSEKSGLVDLVWLDPDLPIQSFTVPIEINLQWYGFDGSINALGLKYELNGWNNYLGAGFTYYL